jgi:hypothetical protein
MERSCLRGKQWSVDEERILRTLVEERGVMLLFHVLVKTTIWLLLVVLNVYLPLCFCKKKIAFCSKKMRKAF